MDVLRMQVEGGFLDGFDVEFAPGLNVLIGARGTGKTSVIELLRFGLGVRNLSADAERKSLDHARAILGGGEVTVTIGDPPNEITVNRKSLDEEPSASGTFVSPLILSQTEIETIGLSAGGRLRLLDGFVKDRLEIAGEEAAAVSAIRSIFREIEGIEAEVANLSQGLDRIPELEKRCQELEAQQIAHEGSSSLLSEKQRDLESLSLFTGSCAVRETVLERFEAQVDGWVARLSAQIDSDFGPEQWDDANASDPLSELRQDYSTAVGRVKKAVAAFAQLRDRAIARRESLRTERIAGEASARSLRADVEKLITGAGAISRELSLSRTRLAQLQSKQKLVSERSNRLLILRTKRNERITALQAIRKNRHSLRSSAAEMISGALAPQIRVEVEQFGQYEEYVSALTEALRGSGLKYNYLAEKLAEQISPLELVELTDNFNFLTLSEITGIPKDRAARVLSHLREVGPAEVVVANVDDNVRMYLLDGLDYKPIDQLSAGQRCTVILSIVLQHSGRTLIIDQPEDHLDNAYIATTVIRALLARGKNSQVILSTHNANIPVLGEAMLVIELTSDGRNGFVQVCEALDHKEAVQAITTVMEGGLSAFEHRAEFYHDHGV